MNEPPTCLLCGLVDPRGLTVRASLACYADDGRFERIDRCVNHQACRERLESEGVDWPLVDITNPRWRESA
jgi:hypothetical protein